jgi:hypothetical protein
LSVSPQLPIATIIEVPSMNLDRTEETVANKGQDEGLSSLKTEAGMNASHTCYIRDKRYIRHDIVLPSSGFVVRRLTGTQLIWSLILTW